MEISRALKIRDRAKTAIADIFSIAALCGMPHSQMLERRSAAFERYGVTKCPQWVVMYLQGYWEAKQEQAYRDSLVYGAMIDGKFYSTHRERDDYYEKHGFSPSAFAETEKNQCGHYWATNLRPFFVSS